MQDGTVGSERARVKDRLVADELHWGTLGDWAELVRLPNIFTILSNSLAAALLVSHAWPPLAPLFLIIAASVLAYWAGMILNDVADFDEDEASGRQRPLVRGSISPTVAGHVGSGMLLTAPLLVLMAVNLQTNQPLWMGAAFMAAVALSVCVRTYNSPIKHTPLAPLLMGLCRSLNVLMVGSAVLALTTQEAFPHSLLLLALGIGVYILGLTVFARREEKESTAGGLGLGIAIQVAGLIVLAVLPWLSDPRGKWYLDAYSAYPILVGLIGITVVKGGVRAMLHPVPRKVQLAVKHSILTIIILDAAVVAASAGPWSGGGVALLLLPALLIGARYRST